MPRSNWLNILIILLVIIATAYVAQLVLSVVSGFGDIILIILLSWLVAYALSPLVERLQERQFHSRIVGAVARVDPRRREPLSGFQISRTLAVALVYFGLAIVVVIVIGSFIPALVVQLQAILPRLSNVDVLQLSLAATFEEILSAFGIAYNLQSVIDAAFEGLEQYATPILTNTVSLLTGVLSILGNALLIILLSFFVALDGPRFTKMVFDAMPDHLHQETRMFLITADRAFGAFLRSQLLQSVIIGIGTGLVLGIFGIQGALLSGLFAGLFMLIPLLGPLFALIPPLLVVLLSEPGLVLWVMIPLIILQAVVVNVLMPRFMGNALGLHPFVIIVALLIGIELAGFWGAFFAMPIAGLISAFGAFLIRRRQRLAELATAIIETEPSMPLPIETEPPAAPPDPNVMPDVPTQESSPV